MPGVVVRAVNVGKTDADWGEVGVSPDLFTVTDRVFMVAVNPTIDIGKVKKVIDEGEEWK